MKIKESRSRKLFVFFNYIFLALFGFITLYPFWYVLVASLNTGRDFVRGGVYFWPREFTLENFTHAFKDSRIFDSLTISVSRTLIGVLIGLFFTALLAYGLSIKTLPGKTFLTFFFYFTTIFGGGMIPYYMLLRDLGLTKSFMLYVIPVVYNFFNFLLLRTYFDTIPYDLRESAQIDGAGETRILFGIYVPLAKPVLATLALFIGVGHWNDWFTGAYYQSKTALYPAATLLQRLLSEASTASTIKLGQETSLSTMTSYTSQSLQMAFVMILTMPIVIVYPFLQKYYVKGVMIGSVKG
ncbi:carbohydrate ABC transporter permease [Anaerocolumna sp. MB42-C2]|uniref:carbohydrate ABC transporter permease n=1 Tax=Anaerocolumna sp. MB42-C2 TaxID=3070997 RepID=UPI0027E1E479|nr:carbohydrate ABC transporter permease [Anaerocolumna sp. MB42-C2]WMJ89923.1 carbohydrate ABC transporter permease [Anaerocolumna sp. MB42-C2]